MDLRVRIVVGRPRRAAAPRLGGAQLFGRGPQPFGELAGDTYENGLTDVRLVRQNVLERCRGEHVAGHVVVGANVGRARQVVQQSHLADDAAGSDTGDAASSV